MRIWFNRSFATNAHLVQSLRSNPDGEHVEVVVTHKNPATPMAGVADQFSLEPDLDDDSYVDWAITFCATHRIDVVVPCHRLPALAAARARFAECGTQLVCGEADAILACESKATVYREAAAFGLRTPPWEVVRRADELAPAVSRIRELAGLVCLKPVVGTGAQGFHVLGDGPVGVDQLFHGHPVRTSHSQVRDALAEAERKGVPVPELMVMPWMDEPETSVDLLTQPGGQLVGALARTKNGRARALVVDDEARECAVLLAEHLGLTSLSNVQFRRWRGELALLEVNARAGAGLFQGALAGVDLLWPAIRMARGQAPGTVVALTCNIPYTTVSSLAPFRVRRSPVLRDV